MKSIIILSVVILFKLTLFLELHAQETLYLYTGARVRFYAPPKLNIPTIARISAFKPDTLVVFVEGSDLPTRLPFSSIKNIELSRGRKSMLQTGAIIGVVVGSIWGVISGLKISEEDCSGSYGPCFEPPAAGLLGGILFGALGGGTGALIGALIQTEKWEPASLKRLNLGFQTQKTGDLLVSLSIRFD